MMEIGLVIIVILVTVLLVAIKSTIRPPLVGVIGSDGVTYYVRDIPDKQGSVEMLVILNKKIFKLMDDIESYAINDKQRLDAIARLRRRFKPKVLSEGVVDRRYTSYTVSKGEQLVMCLRSRDTDNLYDENLLFYVILHELGHIASVSENHTDEFRTNFSFLLNVAIEKGLFHHINQPFNYCGLDLQHT